MLGLQVLVIDGVLIECAELLEAARKQRFVMSSIIALIETYGLMFVFLNVLVEQGGLPIPAYPVLIVSAGLVSRGDYTITQLVVVGTTAALIADTAWFWSGRQYRPSGCRPDSAGFRYLRISACARPNRSLPGGGRHRC